jgi:hypothetical protein
MLRSRFGTFAAVVFIATSLSMSAQPSNGASMKACDLASHGVILLPPGHPQFEAGANEALGDKPSELAKAVKNVAVVIRNSSDKTVIGYTLKWQFKAVDGSMTAKSISYVQSAALLDAGRAKHPPNLPGGILIPPESKRLVSLFGSMGSDSHPGLKVDANVQQQIDKIKALINQSSEVTVVLDSVLFEDGSSAGPNETHALDDFVKSFDGLQAFYRHAMQLVDSGTSEPDIVAWLKTQMVADPGAANQSEFNRHIAATELLGVRERSGMPAAVDLIRSKLYGHRPNFTNMSQ